MSEKRRGLGRGLGALIPSSATAVGGTAAPSRPVDLFFPESRTPGGTREPADETPPTGSETVAGAVSVPSGEGRTTAADVAAAAEDSERPTAEPSPSASKGSGGRNGSTARRKGAPAKSASSAVDAGEDELDLVEVPGAQFAELRVDDIHPNRKQPRSVFDEDEMAELVHSVREIGILQPIVVRRSTESGSETYELVMGERRWRAVQQAGLGTIPAIIRDTSDDDLLRDALLENLHRSQLNPLEEAAAYQQLLEDFGTTHEELADRIGRSRPQISNTIRLLRLPPLVQRRVAAGVLTAGHARALLSLPDAGAMERVAQRIVAEGLSVRATEEAVALYQEPDEPRRNNIPKPNARHERLDFLASTLADRLDTNVKITLGARKGRVSIEFASVEDLNRIMGVLNPGAE
ncbi:ParB/RepB/Spo0J family partition protein [Sinomonas sp. JGH33]|uniref:ParB/RepB/Spo0J family partition protein n=1 Tax=Sinomonas terricola TaxID=3110330 RepID=A0ABU5T795_9MICC|nr:ParB/RepB/Spo0J family partition protein [Sinomonas sp. JGH33]MEA5455544.1 ParB/RepB/Spo0J family partition protein [Sinomonas sp. JGH33]